MRRADLRDGRLLRFVLAVAVTYVAAALTTDAPIMILVLNDLVMSAAAGVCVAYAPLVPRALINPRPTKGEYLGTGIFFVSSSMLSLRIASSIARDLGRPEIYNSAFVTFALTLGLIGALFHLWAPNAVDGRIPRGRWVLTGMVVAIGCFISFGCWTLHMTLTHPTIVELR